MSTWHEDGFDANGELVHAHRTRWRFNIASRGIFLAVLLFYFYDGKFFDGLSVCWSMLAILVLSRFLHTTDDLREEVVMASASVEGSEVLGKVGCEPFIGPEASRTKRPKQRVLPAEHVTKKQFEWVLLSSSLSLTLPLSFLPRLCFSPSLLRLAASKHRHHRGIHLKPSSEKELKRVGLVSLLVDAFSILARLRKLGSLLLLWLWLWLWLLYFLAFFDEFHSLRATSSALDLVEVHHVRFNRVALVAEHISLSDSVCSFNHT